MDESVVVNYVYKQSYHRILDQLSGENAMKPTVKTIASQPSWVVRTSQMELAVTQLGGHMAPVTFYRDSVPVQPYFISPWQGEAAAMPAAVLTPLRGDFFCLPFGGNVKSRGGKTYPPHGDTSGEKWKFVSQENAGDRISLTLSQEGKIGDGNVTKTLSLMAGHNAVYCRHIVAGFSGKMPLGHHATLAGGDVSGALRLKFSPIQFGRTNPTLFSDPATGSYQSYEIDAEFKDIRRVPTLWKDCPVADASAFPARRGFSDLLSVFYKRSRLAWTTVINVRQGWLWFSLKDPAMLPATVVWTSNGGRHGPPWNGRTCCIGIEDVCGHFADGIAESVGANALNKAGIPTAVQFSRRHPTAVSLVQGVVRVRRGFKQVKTLKFAPGEVTFVSTDGKEVTAPIHHEFARGCDLPDR